MGSERARAGYVIPPEMLPQSMVCVSGVFPAFETLFPKTIITYCALTVFPVSKSESMSLSLSM